MAIGGEPLMPEAEPRNEELETTVVQLRAERHNVETEPSEIEDVARDADERASATPKPRSRGTRGEFLKDNARALTAVALLGAGIVFVLLGWYGAANTNILTEQIPYLISGGLLGVALIIVAGFFASSASLERQNRELREDLRQAIGSMGSSRPAYHVGPAGAPSADGQVYVVNGGRSYHFAGCPIVEGKESSALPLAKARDDGYAACKLCGRD